MADRETVERWAYSPEAGHAAMKRLAEDMPGVTTARKHEVVAWMMEHRFEVLAEALAMSTRRMVHMTSTQYSNAMKGFVFVCRCGAVSEESHDSRNTARKEGDAHLDQHRTVTP